MYLPKYRHENCTSNLVPVAKNPGSGSPPKCDVTSQTNQHVCLPMLTLIWSSSHEIKALKVLWDGACGMLVAVGRGVNYSMAFKIDIAIQY